MAIEPAPETRLATIAEALNTEHRACEEALKSSLAHAIRAGELLHEAKALVQHGAWLPWLDAQFAGSVRTAQNYMRIATEYPRLAADPNTQRVAYLPYREALQLLAPPREVADGEPPPPLAVHFSSSTPEWYTPPDIITRVVQVLGAIDLDPCASSHDTPTVPAAQVYTAADDGLAQPWAGRVYLNPPYGSVIGAWLEKLARAYQARQVPAAVALVPARTDTAWFRWLDDCALCFIQGRLRFSGAENSAPFPSVAAYFGADPAAFARNFAGLGPVWTRWTSADVA